MPPDVPVAEASDSAVDCWRWKGVLVDRPCFTGVEVLYSLDSSATSREMDGDCDAAAVAAWGRFALLDIVVMGDVGCTVYCV